MACILCKRKSVIELQQGGLCRDCFVRYFERKVYKTIRRHGLFGKHDKLCVACSGGKDSLAVLHLVSRLAKKRGQKIFALGIDEGVKGYRDKQLEDMVGFCEEHGIDCVIVSFEQEFGHTIEQLMGIASKRGLEISQCALCGILRRRLLNKYAKELGATRIVVGHNLDDEAQTIMMNLFKGGMELAARMGPSTGVRRHPGLVPRVKPLYFCTELETSTYTKLLGFKVLYKRCPYRKFSYRAYVARHLDGIDKDYKGTKTSLIQNFLQILPMLKKRYSGGKIPVCGRCGEPSKRAVCVVCGTLDKLGIK
ncbi:MAG: TIGR00269 family protein [Candidatus Aenigmarchaeota archaeon]|nr:TIGR00269 family protein [Candidatus Aenigmarchaeota archaeon]